MPASSSPAARLLAPARAGAAAAAAAALDLLLPMPCAGCASARGPLCPACRGALPARPLPARAAGEPPGLPPVAAGGVYRGVLRAVLLAHKDGATPLAQPLGVVVAAAVAAAVPVSGGSAGPVVLVPVPSARAAVRARGHDHALRLAQSAARELREQGRPASVVAALRQHRAVDDQGSLDAAGRAHNLHGAVVVRRLGRLRAARRSSAEVVLVDDVCASGATLAECAQALGRAGVPPGAAAVAAATVLRSPRPPRSGGAPARGVRPGATALDLPLPSSGRQD